jgi:nucleoside-diphosphate-sugar epimerase
MCPITLRRETLMHVFVTGGTGTIGSATIAELLAHGHSVLALARSDASAATLTAAGAEPLRGTLGDLDVLREGANRTDGVVSLAFNHDIAAPDALQNAIAEEGAAMDALGEVLVGSDRPFVVVSGTPWVSGRASTEADPLPLEGPVAGRARSVNAALELADRGVRSSAVRMPRTVHNEGQGGFAGILTQRARELGVVGHPGDGTQRWPAVHAKDAAALLRIALESAPAGSAWHAVADEGDAVLDIATVIGRRLGLSVEQLPPEAFGPFGPIFAMDQPASSAVTRAQLGWTPTHPSLLEDLENLQP